jgi:imidazoleglycerol phosphate dehydratase HisB
MVGMERKERVERFGRSAIPFDEISDATFDLGCARRMSWGSSVAREDGESMGGKIVHV